MISIMLYLINIARCALNRNDLIVTTGHYGQRDFLISGPRLGTRSLLRDIRQSIDKAELFKKNLKTYFFHMQQ